MKTKYTSKKTIISLSAALMLIVTLSAGAYAQHVDHRLTLVDPHIQIETVPEIGIVSPYGLRGTIHLGVFGDDHELVHSGEMFWVTEDQNQAPEIRIMSRIIQTALAGVEAPELPEELTERGEVGEVAYVTASRGVSSGWNVVPIAPLGYSPSRGKVSGFYMAGYGYLFTINWPIRSSNLLSTFYRSDGENLVVQLQAQNKALEQLMLQRTDRTRGRADAGSRTAVAEQTEEEVAAERQEAVRKAEELAEEIEAWRSELEDRLVESLMDVMATYGHTLHQAASGESITFIFEQSNDDEANITLTIEQSELAGPSEKDRALSAIRVTRGSENSNPALKEQVAIMAEIIDAAFEAEEEDNFRLYISASTVYFGGEARTQYIPGYGVIFRKNARMNPFVVLPEPPDPPSPPADADARTVDRRPPTVSRRVPILIQEHSEESEEKLTEHLNMLKLKTAEILVTYGTTLTELDDSEWLGINFEVGSAASLLQSGVSEFLVLVQMHRVREAADHGADAAAWLMENIVTNEKKQ